MMANAYALGEAASRTTAQVDALFLFITVVSLFFFLLVEGLLIYFAIKYRRRKGAEAAETPDIRSNFLLETIWILIPSVVVLIFFYYGYRVFRDIRAPVPGASDIHTVARQFLFEFRYPDGRSSINELRVPVGRPVKLILSSDDVIHSFYIPAYRIKQDMVPGQFTTLYLHPDKEGTYEIYCAEYCGVGHSTMRARLVVMEAGEYARWREEKTPVAGLSLAEQGKALVEKSGCLGCHNVEGKESIGPNFGGVFGRKVLLADGTSLAADEEYLRESILEPNAKLVKGYPAVMPTFKGTLSPGDVTTIIAYLKSLSGKEVREGREEQGEKGKALAETYGCLGCHSTDGSVVVGPSFRGLFGRQVELEGGGKVTADEAYLVESINRPREKIVKGFPNIMPEFKGKISEEDLSAIVGYLKTVRQ
ncbi:MAG TPA: cytochrome c oxidase subunit II [Candidatus Deferrimicrobiaceae bacterium]|nr:cytochrome c oxidase subunit II [Candidatus Deferrimicrobiaceae bacterium]